MTRALAYRKNDQAWIEQKNGAIVRKLVGYGRFEGLESVMLMTELYRAARLHTNLIQPSFKLRFKTRIDTKVIKKYHPPIAPAHRALLHAAVDERAKDALRSSLADADPVLLLTRIRAAQDALGDRVDRRGIAIGVATTRPAMRPAVPLDDGASHGAQRSIRRRPYKRRNPVPRRSRMLDAHEQQMRAWLGREPGVTAAQQLQS